MKSVLDLESKGIIKAFRLYPHDEKIIVANRIEREFLYKRDDYDNSKEENDSV